MTPLRNYLGPILLLISTVLTVAMIMLGLSGHGFPRWLLELTLVF